jgi:hypothetical protein
MRTYSHLLPFDILAYKQMAKMERTVTRSGKREDMMIMYRRWRRRDRRKEEYMKARLDGSSIIEVLVMFPVSNLYRSTIP